MTDYDDWDMVAAREKFRAKVDGGKGARKKRQKKTQAAVDQRSLRSTGRTEHLNYKATPQIKELLAKHVPKRGVSLWLEEAIVAKLKTEGVEVENA